MINTKYTPPIKRYVSFLMIVHNNIVMITNCKYNNVTLKHSYNTILKYTAIHFKM